MVVLTREQLEDRLAALHRASLELVSDLSLESVLERIVKMARDQANAQYAALGVVDKNGTLTHFIPVGMSGNESINIGPPPLGKGLLGLFSEVKKTFRVSEIETDPRSAGFPPNHPRMKSFLGVPILSGDRWLGQIYLADKIGYHEFTEQDEIVIETLAAYAAVAITNAKLYEGILDRDQSLTRRNEDLSLINNVATSLAISLDVDDILTKTLNLLMTRLDIETGEIFLREEGDKHFYLAKHSGLFTETFWTRESFRVGEGAIGMVAEKAKPIPNLPIKRNTPYIRRTIVEAGYKYISLFPLISGGAVIGVIAVATKSDRHLVDRENNLLGSISSWAAITIENARLHRQAQRLAILEERERIGMDLHDGIIQSIYGVGLALDYARLALEDNPAQTRKKIEQSIEALNATIRDLRTYILDLRPRQFHGENLQLGIQRLVDEFQANSGIRVKYMGPDNGLIDFPANNATSLFHICQEALANVAKHSGAEQTVVHLWTAMDRVLLEVTDDGQGFDLRKMSVTLGHGLSNMHFRARKVGGDVEITSYPDEGTTILAWVPRWSIGT